MKCTKCGDENVDDAKFCASCGAALPETPTSAPPITPITPVTPVAPVTTVTPASEPVSTGLKTGILIGSIFLPLLGIIMGAIYMNDANPAKKVVGKLWLMVGIGAFVLWCLLSALMQSAVS